TLEDYIEHHEIEYEFIDGVYWRQCNSRISNTIVKLFELRKEAKKDGKNILQAIYKLIMNSAYGKTLLKPSKYKHFYEKNENMTNVISKMYNNIVKITPLSNNDMSRVKTYSNRYEDYNRAHCGVLVLSMSKRIMN